MKIALIGYGKMGKAIEAIALERGHEILYRVDLHNKEFLEKGFLQQADLAIEFTTPDTALENIHRCFDADIPVVSGTTGWLDKLEEIHQRCRQENKTFLYASNFSIGVNIFFEVNKQLAALMNAQQQYDVKMEEIHHTQKKDAPSGTAISLAEQVLERVSRKKRWVNGESAAAEELEIRSRREDPAPGTHTVTWGSPVDDITITHTAHSREGFASGAVTAAEWIQGKRGIFTMKDVLGLS
ncbi:4-hydroxy-tetrahydrodipicolinate reductase [Compostibacter hankyongensis]|uniref:4-hydroxy-tetrahydrodipicolinate reductase n=1 Tax=Compostibacter hankyongensis TaxID=1007089 RepID=A0ABP8FWV8_9BACT